MKRTVYHILPSLVSRGQGRFVAQLMDGLSRQESWEGKVYYFNAVKEFELTNSTMVRFWDKQRFEMGSVLHTHNLRGDLYVLYQICRGGKNFKWISTLHQDVVKDLRYKFHWFDIRRYILGFLFRALVLCPDHVVCLTSFMQRDLLDNYKVKKSSIIGNAVSTNRSSIPLNLDLIKSIEHFRNQEKTLIVNACNITRGKALDQIVQLLRFKEDAVYFLFGEGIYKEELLKKAELHGVKDRFIFLGNIPLAFRYFPYFDLLLFTSFSEGFPITILEAATLKVPIVCSRLPMITEVYPDSCLYYFENNDILNLKDAIDEARIDSQKKVENMYSYYSNNYTVNIMSQKYIDLYNTLINE